MIKFSIYLFISLLIVFPILRAGMIKQEFSYVTQTAILSISFIVWVGLVWYVAPPTNMFIALAVMTVAFEVALWISSKLVSWWQSKGYLSSYGLDDDLKVQSIKK
jgi:hypothetical protein